MVLSETQQYRPTWLRWYYQRETAVQTDVAEMVLSETQQYRPTAVQTDVAEMVLSETQQYRPTWLRWYYQR